MPSDERGTITSDVFASAVEATLAPVLFAEGFKAAGSSAFQLRFQRRRVFVTVGWAGPQGGECWISISSDDSSDPPLHLQDLLRVTDFPEQDLWLASMMTQDADALSRLLTRAADLLVSYARPGLQGDEEFIAKAYAVRAARARDYTGRVSVSARTLEAADWAWQQKDYDRVLALLGPVRDRLDKSRRRRLDFAQRHSG
jgi:hypothetical protein